MRLNIERAILIALLASVVGCTAITVMGTHNKVSVQKGSEIADDSAAPKGSNKTVERKNDDPFSTDP